MSMFTSFNISASGMTAQQLRTDVISENIANANTTRTSDGTPYVRKAVVFTEKTLSPATYVKGASAAGSSFASILHNASGGRLGDGVKVTSVYEDDSTDMNLVYDPSHSSYTFFHFKLSVGFCTLHGQSACRTGLYTVTAGFAVGVSPVNTK